MHGLKNAASLTHDTRGAYGPYVQLAYNTRTGDVLATWHPSESSYTHYHDDNIIAVETYTSPATMQDIADAVKRVVDRREMLDTAPANTPAKIAANNRYTSKTYHRIMVNFRVNEDAALIERIAAIAEKQGISEGAAVKQLLQAKELV